MSRHGGSGLQTPVNSQTKAGAGFFTPWLSHGLLIFTIFVAMAIAVGLAGWELGDYYATLRPVAAAGSGSGLPEVRAALDAADRLRLEIAGITLIYIIILTAFFWLYWRESKRRDNIEESLLGATRRAENASQAKTTFLAQMSHELRSPLNAIMGFAELIRDEVFGKVKPEYQEYAGNIYESGAHLLELINEILEMARVEAGKATLDERVVDVRNAIEASLRLVSVRAEAECIRLATEIESPLPTLYVDERKLRQILINLLTNAIKFTPKGGLVTTVARVTMNGDFVLIVRDTGVGIAPENIEKVLEPFGQVSNAFASKNQGTGLGLPLTNSFAQLHGGRLKIESTPGKGTSVTITFPAERVIRLDKGKSIVVSLAG